MDIFRVCLQVRDVHHRAIDDDSAGHCGPGGPAGEQLLQTLDASRDDMRMRNQMEQFAVVSCDSAEAPVAQTHCAVGDGVENRLDVGRRAADDSENLARRRLLLERFRKLLTGRGLIEGLGQGAL